MKINLIYGGKSPEHEVSVDTAFSVMAHLDYTKHTVRPIYITKDSTWIAGAWLEEPLDADKTLYLTAGETPEYRSKTDGPSIGRVVTPSEVLAPDILTFPVVHGPNGEDGTIQGLFESLNVPYVGCGVLASAAGMDKITAKYLFHEAGIPQVPFVPVLWGMWQREPAAVIQRIEQELNYPLFVKPSNMGSSVGISMANDRAALEAAIALAFRYDHRVLVEAGIDAREIELAVLADDAVHVSVPGELVKEKAFYDYQAKYVDDTVKLQIPADLPADITQRLQDYAKRAFMILDGAGLARCDFFLTRDGSIYINEVNTMPGFTSISMYPQLWAATGVPYAELLERLMQAGLLRYREKQQLELAGSEQ